MMQGSGENKIWVFFGDGAKLEIDPRRSDPGWQLLLDSNTKTIYMTENTFSAYMCPNGAQRWERHEMKRAQTRNEASEAMENPMKETNELLKEIRDILRSKIK